jgi:hypothetical protein
MDSPPKRLWRLPLKGAALVDRQSRIHGACLALLVSCLEGAHGAMDN